VSLVLALVAAAAGADPAREILDRRKLLDETERHWDDREQAITLHLYGSQGGERTRELVVYERRLEGDERQSILFFERPAEVRGTGFLSFSHPSGPADQWLFLPALKRVRQITAQTRKESFVGTDLSYHDLDLLQDMPSWTEADAASKSLGDADVDGVATHVIELRPKLGDVDYGRIQLWLGKDDLISRRTHFFDGADDPADSPIKEIVQSEIKLVGKIPVPHQVEVVRPQRGSRTVMKVTRIRFDQGLEEDLFTQRTLERGER
jgi:hypothetical protein